MDRIIVQHTLIRAESIEQFRHQGGQRILCKPYYRRLKDGTLLFEFITRETDPAELQRYIQEGKIYLVES